MLIREEGLVENWYLFLLYCVFVNTFIARVSEGINVYRWPMAYLNLNMHLHAHANAHKNTLTCTGIRAQLAYRHMRVHTYAHARRHIHTKRNIHINTHVCMLMYITYTRTRTCSLTPNRHTRAAND